jgi:hypothetical protein
VTAQRSWEWRWTVPGYDVGRLLGYGPGGDVWLATRTSSGEPVVLRRMTGFAPADVAAAIASVPELPTEHVVRLLDVREVEGEAVLVMEHVGAGSLADLVRRRGPLSAGQVVTALAPIALALAAAHARGLSHGRISAAEVLLTAEGRPLLDGLGMSGLLHEPADDVQALVQLARELLGDAAALVEGEWSDAAAIGRALLAACPAEPLFSPASPPQVVPGRPIRGLVIAAVLVLVSSVVIAARLVAVPATAAPTSWSSVLAGLDQARATAFARGDPGLLAAVYAAGSADLKADTERLRHLVSQHQRADGLTHELVSVRVVQAGRDRVTLEVLQRLRAYVLRGPGSPRTVAAGPVQRQGFSLVRTGTGWRITDIRA